MDTIKTCTWCKEKKSISLFYKKNRRGKQFLDVWCKECKLKYNKEYDKNPINRARREKRIYSEGSRKKRSNAAREYAKSSEGQYNLYKTAAKARKIVFSIDKDSFLSFRGKECFYCGDVLDRVRLDRMDNKEGYLMSNLVPSCIVCNWMKGSRLSVESFISKCILIAKNH